MGDDLAGSKAPPQRPARLAVVGAGPAGLYAAAALLEDERVEVDLIERVPAPYGLVRYGVAPDHQKIKSVTKALDKILAHPRLRFLGNVALGPGGLSIADLGAHYDQILLSVGCAADRRLGVAGEDAAGSHPATSFVAWYNGHPDFIDYPVSLDATRAAVIGVGDVSMDLARMLTKSVAELAKTDITPRALEVLRQSRVEEVIVIGRRGPAEAAFAQKEIEDIAELDGVDVVVDRAQLRAALDDAHLDTATRRKLEFLATLPTPDEGHAARRVRLLFLASPVEVLEQDGRVRALVIEHNELLRQTDGSSRARGTGRKETLDVGLVFRSVGYRGTPIDGVPFDDKSSVIPNQGGRVTANPGGPVVPRLYVAGWIKRGPSGVIGTNKPDAIETATAMKVDLEKLELSAEPERSRARVDALLRERGLRAISWADWKRLDSMEREHGATAGKVREKLLTLDEVLRALGE